MSLWVALVYITFSLPQFVHSTCHAGSFTYPCNYHYDYSVVRVNYSLWHANRTQEYCEYETQLMVDKYKQTAQLFLEDAIEENPKYVLMGARVVEPCHQVQ